MHPVYFVRVYQTLQEILETQKKIESENLTTMVRSYYENFVWNLIWLLDMVAMKGEHGGVSTRHR